MHSVLYSMVVLSGPFVCHAQSMPRVLQMDGPGPCLTYVLTHQCRWNSDAVLELNDLFALKTMDGRSNGYSSNADSVEPSFIGLL